MSGRVAVVTGAASGIGLGVARRLAADGHAVALLDRDGALAGQVADSLTATGARAASYEVDVADRGALQAVYAAVRKELGPITILVTSAGIEAFDPIADITPEKWDRIIAVNLTGTFTCMQLAVPDMMAAGWGRIVTISSSSAQSGAPNMAHYVASKGGVIGLTKAFAREFAGNGITVNTIPPTIVDTPMARKGEAEGNVASIEVLARMVPLGRAGTPDDIAGACSYLCSDDGVVRHRPDHRSERGHVHLSPTRRIGTETSKTRAALLEAAERLMLEEGYAAVTSRRVAAEAGLKPQLVHYYFRTMDDLFLALFRQRAGQSLEGQARALASEQPLWALWELSRDPRGTALTMEFTAMANHRKAIRAEIAASAERYRAEQLRGIRELFARYGVDEDVLPPSSGQC